MYFIFGFLIGLFVTSVLTEAPLSIHHRKNLL